ncbi:NTP transferase domain-containing protein [Nesterenkonia sp. MY13]|uniref:NTP transferase domain-containing protein n=1 Tax=Nesterenkonia sedimenti TaxID=1463632 RepID=A0A7X8THT2_9MICC|nr:NTP transferase domain-containing protein [Nesterenkonia sedimenti]NLS08976.1 NTP transferase domain-containing protein [Nesterenkonia sedimenti]
MPAAEPGPGLAAVLLAGGAGSRLGGADKALLRRDGRSLLRHWTEALAERGIGGVVVGPENLGALLPAEGFSLTREDPPLAGPAAGVCAGVRALVEEAPVAGQQRTDDGAVLLLSVDTVEPAPLLDWLIDWLPALRTEQNPSGEEAIVPRDAEGRFQMLCSMISTDWLSARVQQLSPGEENGQSLRWLLAGARTAHPVLPAGLNRDVDTPEDAAELGVELAD